MSVIRAPGNAEFYGAPGLWARFGRDGYQYVVATGNGPGYKDIGPIAFRIAPNGSSEWLNIGKPPTGIAGFVVEYDSYAEVVWFGADNRSWVGTPIPGYVPRGLPDSSGQVTIPLTPTTPVDAEDDDVDEEAREYTSAVKKLLYEETGKLAKRITALEGSGGGINKDEAWQLSRDSVYHNLVFDQKSGIREHILLLIHNAIGTSPGGGLSEDRVRAIIAEELSKAKIVI